MLIVAALLLAGTIEFSDVAERAGLQFVHVSGSVEKNYILETISGGVAWIDYNRDNWPDLYLVNGGRWDELAQGKRSVSNALFQNNRDGTFTDVTRNAGVGGTGWGMGVAVADFDNDGWPDLYVCNYGPNTLYRNNGDGTFSDVTDQSRVGTPGWSSSAAFGDYDGDGWLDLYVANYVEFDFRKAPPPKCQYRGIQVHCGPEGMKGTADLLYRNNRDGTFVEIKLPEVVPSYGLGVVWLDFDNDGDLDLYVANDSMPNFLFENREGGEFEEIGLLSGAALNQDGKSQAGMGIAVGDYDQDGYLDLYVTNFADDYNTLYRNSSNPYQDWTHRAEIAFPTWQFLGWGTDFFDFNNDGRPDLFVSNGHIYPQVDEYEIGTSFAQRKLLFQNRAGGRFSEVAESMGADLTHRWSSRGSAYADFDNDGDLDVAVNNMDDRPSLFRNDGGNRSGNWISLSLEGVITNRSAIGVRATLRTGAGRQIQEVRAGGSYQSTSDFRLHFGVAASKIIQELVVRWTDGKEQGFEDISANQRYHLKEGGALQIVD